MLGGDLEMTHFPAEYFIYLLLKLQECKCQSKLLK